MDLGKKYELIHSDKEGLYRIKALKDFNDVKKGDIGGYIEGEKNLSQYGDCWIYSDAIVRDNAQVCGNASVWGKAVVMDNARVFDNAFVWGYARIYDNVIVRDNAEVYDKAEVCDNAVIQDNANVCGEARIYDNVVVMGNAVVNGYTEVDGDAIISSDRDYIVFKNWWSSGRYFTWTRSNDKWKVGCFYGTGEELITKAYKDSEEKGREYEKIVKYVESILI